MPIKLSSAHREEIVDHGLGELPNEACGIVAGTDSQVEKVFRMTNAERSPETYVIDPQEQFRVFNEIEDQGWEMLGIYHSHTESDAYPSPTDIRLAYYPEVLYLILSLRDGQHNLRAFHIREGKITEEEIVVE